MCIIEQKSIIIDCICDLNEFLNGISVHLNPDKCALLHREDTNNDIFPHVPTHLINESQTLLIVLCFPVSGHDYAIY